MHIADGILPPAWCVAGHALALGGVALLGRRVEPAEVARMGMMSAAGFVVSMLHFPLLGTSVHLGLMGFTGVLLGGRAFPVIYTTLLFQALLFQHGGLLALGVNALNMGLGALAAIVLWRAPGLPEVVRGGLAGFAGTYLPALLLVAEFEAAGYGKGFAAIAAVYLAVAVIEGALTATAVTFVRQAKPALLEGR
ncbi:MAG: CbiM family transporter [Acidobacteriota bacterium]|jgi:cobalt/nickel transport system permease protein